MRLGRLRLLSLPAAARQTPDRQNSEICSPNPAPAKTFQKPVSSERPSLDHSTSAESEPARLQAARGRAVFRLTTLPMRSSPGSGTTAASFGWANEESCGFSDPVRFGGAVAAVWQIGAGAHPPGRTGCRADGLTVGCRADGLMVDCRAGLIRLKRLIR
jgi:hypothetical protein